MFGSSLMAEDRKILIVLAGDLSGIKKLASYLKGVIARETITVSDKSEKAALLKIIGMISKGLAKGYYMLPRGENP
ncbi:hypothetical protein BDV33DRAFT_201700 [Aspergillus novoparasiticus]|uniref:Uncharacterized protein n=1 Tax=Aspergillus novoparasiticus TaxID=986946 RepID=A0A5N6EYT6_9EURO|nr:hypothetical protein BDV33DRAFT_201700 [Aspergillus novoparasiticus]